MALNNGGCVELWEELETFSGASARSAARSSFLIEVTAVCLAPGHLALRDAVLSYSHTHIHTSSGLMPGVLLMLMPLCMVLLLGRGHPSGHSEAIGLASLYGVIHL